MKICQACDARFDHAGWRCPACGLAPPTNGYVRLTEDLPDLVVAYQVDEFLGTAAAEAESFWAQNRNALVVWALRTYFPTAQSFLEVGCGTGIVLKAVREAFPELSISGGDPYGPALEVAMQVEGVELLQVDALHLPFESQFDAVGLFDVLEHVADDERLLSEIHRTLRPSGGIVVTVPQHRWLWSAADQWALHHRRYTRPQLVAKLESARFEIIRITSFVSLLLPALAIARSRLLNRSQYDPSREFRIARPIEPVLKPVMSAESMLIRAGLSFRLGGSLLVVAVRSDSPGYASRGAGASPNKERVRR